MMRRRLALLVLALLVGCGEAAPRSVEDKAADATVAAGGAAADGDGARAQEAGEGAGADAIAREGAGIAIGGEVPAPYRLTPAIFAEMPRIEVTAVDHGGDTVQFRGARMSDVLARAGVEFGAALRGPRMASYLLVDAADGYRAVFALAELDAGFGHGEVYLVDEANGEALGPEAGPFRVVAPGDSRPARWVRQVTGLSIRGPEVATTR